ncbi:tumor necrosis factor-like [Heterodontus francisci]|uniref:tumor necrosis factor-like n=1 Tax=Heterodontus francisci TaxID=7792 RepID=UPI00355C93B1
MNNERMLLAAEMGGQIVEKQTDVKNHRLCQVLCAITALGLVTFASYLLLGQLGVLSSKQKTALIVKSAQGQGVGDLPAEPLNDDLPRLMNVVGKAPKKIAVHLTASLNTRGKKKVTWQRKGGLPSGVEFKDNGLVIRIPGRYFVYTQVVFYSRGCQNKPIYLSHELYKLSTSIRTKTTLLSTMKSTCHSVQHGDPWYKTTYQGATFEFVGGDHIFSRVGGNEVHYVNTEVGKSYFGLFAL